ncbi:MAG: hypothetical protein Fur0037_19720 [Planctomycetota bacterium]
MAKKNCWEFKNCGRQPGGPKVAKLGICPAATEPRVDGVNHGKNGGRACWAVAGTLCGGKVQGTYAMKLADCLSCDFYAAVRAEEGHGMAGPKEILDRLRPPVPRA